MKKIILMSVIVIATSFFTKASAQLKVNINIGSQPTWGPTGYDHVDYYYMPDVDMYYYVPKRQYIYMQGGKWRFSTVLPRQYSNFDINTGYKVVVNEAKPYNRAAYYRTKYASYKGNHDQQIIRNSHDEKYWQIKDHPDHDKWKNNNSHNNGNKNNNNNGHH